MQIEKRGAKWRVRLRPDGQPQVSKTFNDRRAAEDWGKRMEDAARAGTLHEARAADITLQEVIDRYGERVAPTLRGEAQALQRLRQLRATPLGKLKLSAITRAVVRDFRDRELKRVTGSTWNRTLSLLSQLLKHAAVEMDVQIDRRAICGDLRCKENAARTGRISPEVEAKLVAVEPWVALAIATGCRRGELFEIRHSDIDRQQMLLTIRGTKTRAGHRTIPLSAATLARIDAMPRSISDDRVLWQIEHVDTLTARFADAAKRVGEPDLVLHLCRHEAISRLAEKGATIPLLKSFSGHATLAMLARYARPDSDGLRQMVA